MIKNNQKKKSAPKSKKQTAPKKTANKGSTPAKRSAPISSNSKKAKNVIRAEIRTHYKPHEYGVRSTVDAVKKDADAYNNGDSHKRWHSNYTKGAALVDAGCFGSPRQQREMLGKIYGKKKVETWDGDKVHNTYKHLIGREYDAMLNEKRKKK